MGKHLVVHRGRNQDRSLSGQQQCGEQIVGNPSCSAGDEVGGCRGDDNKIGFVTELYVGERRIAVPQRGQHRSPSQRFESYRTHELSRGRSEDHVHCGPDFGQQPRERAGLIARYSPRHAKNDVPAG